MKVLDPKKQPVRELLSWIAEDCGNEEAEAEICTRLKTAEQEREYWETEAKHLEAALVRIAGICS